MSEDDDVDDVPIWRSYSDPTGTNQRPVFRVPLPSVQTLKELASADQPSPLSAAILGTLQTAETPTIKQGASDTSPSSIAAADASMQGSVHGPGHARSVASAPHADSPSNLNDYPGAAKVFRYVNGSIKEIPRESFARDQQIRSSGGCEIESQYRSGREGVGNHYRSKGWKSKNEDEESDADPGPIAVKELVAPVLPDNFLSPDSWFGDLHSFHYEVKEMGSVDPELRTLTKNAFEGRLSLISESHMLAGGAQKYMVKFSGGEMSKADGVGFVFTKRLPCTKNIQRIVSIFINQRGRVCLRVNSEVVKFSACLKPLEVGDLIGLHIDLQERRAHFIVWPVEGGPPSHADFAFGRSLNGCKGGAHLRSSMTGAFACVVKNCGVTLSLLS